jgi:hypothetical protein
MAIASIVFESMRIRWRKVLLLLVTAINFFASVVVFAQISPVSDTEADYHQFNQIFIKETEKSGSDSGGIKILHPSSLPGWLYQFPASGIGISYALGISDPGMDTSVGFQLAVLRAKAVFAILHQSRVTSIIDNFSNEESQSRTDDFITKYENLYNIESSFIVGNTQFEIINRHFTSFGEAIVLMKFTEKPDEEAIADTIRVLATAYQVERQKQNTFESEDRYEISLNLLSLVNNTGQDGFHYLFKSVNNLVEIESSFGSGKHNFPYTVFRYTDNTDSSAPVPEHLNFQKLNYGLWKSYFQLVIQKIALLSHPLSGNLKQVGDEYTSRNQNLSREITEALPSFIIKRICIRDNCLAMDLDYSHKIN